VLVEVTVGALEIAQLGDLDDEVVDL